MHKNELLNRFRELHVWRRGGERAPHKPLLLLLAMGWLSRGEPRLIPYASIDRPLQELLREFGPPRRSFHSEYPFWRLQSDGVWELANAERVQSRTGNSDAKKSELLKYNVSGGFKEDVFDALINDRGLLRAAAFQLVELAFPESYHADILSAVGLDDFFESMLRRKRDPQFREMVLMAYDYKCAVCGIYLRLDGPEIGLEAAHVRWHQAGGPDAINNGLALCSLHHKLLDRGAIGITSELRVQVSPLASGNDGFDNWVLPFHGTPMRAPTSIEHLLEQEFVAWHSREVFRATARSR